MKKFAYILGVLFLCSEWHVSAQKISDSNLPVSDPRTFSIKEDGIKTVLPPASLPVKNIEGTQAFTDRKVFFVHGHGGSAGSWSRVAAATQNTQSPPVTGYPARKISSQALDYSQSPHSVSSGSSMIKNVIDGVASAQVLGERKRNVVIAHSLGSLVTQYTDLLYETEDPADDRGFYGLVTVGGPNKGAILAQNTYPFPGSKGNEFANDIITRLSKGPLVETIETTFLLDLFLNGQAVHQQVAEFTEKWSDDIATVLLAGFNTSAANDLKPGSQVINTLQSFIPPTTRRIAFYGHLPNTDLIWKTYHYMKNSPNAEAPFQADNGHLSVEKMNANRARYQAKWDEWNSQVEFLENNFWGGLLDLLNANNNALNEAVAIRNAWGTGLMWWNEANDKWRNLCGDLQFQNVANGQCNCTDYNVNTGQSTYFTMFGPDCSGPQPGHPVYRQCSFQSALLLQDVETDGIVPVSSQVALPGAIKTVEMIGDSHFQQTNSPRLKAALYQLWNGDHDLFFKTAER